MGIECAEGLAALAPTANGSPTPIVPIGPELRRWPGTKVGIDWRPSNHLTHPTTIRASWERAHSPSPEEQRRIEEEQRRVSTILASRNKLLY